jgi:hypothetical protein
MFPSYDEGAMMITPQARRRITAAIGALPDARSRDQWGAWAQAAAPNQIRTDVPYEIAAIAYAALRAAELEIERRLAEDALDEGALADLANDLGYVQAIETALRNEGIGR